MNQAEQARLRAVVFRALQVLADDLDTFEQTTHGTIHTGGPINEVCESLELCYNEPSAYSVSGLRQAIGYFFEEEG